MCMDLVDGCKISQLEVHCYKHIVCQMDLAKSIEVLFGGD